MKKKSLAEKLLWVKRNHNSSFLSYHPSCLFWFLPAMWWLQNLCTLPESSAGDTLSLTFSFCLIPKDLSAFVSLEERLESRKKVCESFPNTFCLPACSLWGFFFEGQLSPPCITVILWSSGSCLNTHTVSAFQHLCVGAALSMVLFAGQLSGQNQQTVGTLDLGGASTQITFLPRFEVRSG